MLVWHRKRFFRGFFGNNFKSMQWNLQKHRKRPTLSTDAYLQRRYCKLLLEIKLTDVYVYFGIQMYYVIMAPSVLNAVKIYKLFITCKRSVMITQEMCPIRTDISTHKHLGKCIYLLFVSLAVVGFRQNYFYILLNFGAKMSNLSLYNQPKNKIIL